MNINNLIISGWVQTDPQEILTRSGKRNVRFRAINTKRYPRADGTWGENKIFFDVVAWGNVLVDRILDTVHKNIEVVVEGALSINSYQDKQGVRKFKTECLARNVEVVEPESISMEQREETHSHTEEAPGYEDDIPF